MQTTAPQASAARTAKEVYPSPSFALLFMLRGRMMGEAGGSVVVVCIEIQT
jgi:hypothetical protein